MKKIFGALLLSLSIGSMALAQDNKSSEKPKSVSKPSRDHFMVYLSSDHWTNLPDSVETRNSGRGVGVYLMYDFPIKKSNFSFGAGLGFRWSNIYLKNEKMDLSSTVDRITFSNTDGEIVKGNKYVSKHIEFPLELRYFADKENRNRGFKFAIGAKVGYTGLGGAFYKQRESIGGKFVNYKTVNDRYSQQWRLTPTARIGWGNFSIFAEYTPTPIFTTTANVDVRPLSFGLVISGL